METEQVQRFTLSWTQTQTSILAFVSSSVTTFSDADDILQQIAEGFTEMAPEVDVGGMHSLTV